MTEPAASRDAIRAAKELIWLHDLGPAEPIDASTTHVKVTGLPAEIVDAVGVGFKNLARGASQWCSASEPGP